MAHVVSKSNLFSPCLHHQPHRHRENRSSAFPINCKSGGVRWEPLVFRLSSSSNSQIYGSRIVDIEQGQPMAKKRNPQSFNPQMSLLIGKSQKWWEKGLQPNMKEITSAQDLVTSLFNAGDKLVVLAFFSPGCGGCKALHPKVCQLAEMNPEVEFLEVNYEEHKSMCYSLNVHVLPFFRFYRGAHGRLCSFSCTNATIKKFKDALAKHTPARCSLGPPKGLEEKELLALAANKDLSFSYTPKPKPAEEEEAVPVPLPAEKERERERIAVAETSHSNSMPPLPLPRPYTTSKGSEDKNLVTSGR